MKKFVLLEKQELRDIFRRGANMDPGSSMIKLEQAVVDAYMANAGKLERVGYMDETGALWTGGTPETAGRYWKPVFLFSSSDSRVDNQRNM